MMAIVRKEFREYRGHRTILLTAVGLPLIFMLLPFLNLLSLTPSSTASNVDLALGQTMFVFFLTPVIVPAAMAAYSIIGEKEQDTLEPVLTLPLTDREFIHAKVAAIVAPSALSAIAVYAGFLVLSAILVHNQVRDDIFQWRWALGVVLMAVPLSLYSTLTGLGISARARDLRVAEQLAGLVILPTLVPIALITFEIIPVGPLTWAAFLGIVLAVDSGLLALTYRTFNRERAVAMAA
jgi:ABC-2 type transport system permease protein